MKKLWPLVVLLGMTITARAEEPPKFDMSKPLVDLQGKPVSEEGLPLTLGSVAGSCLAKEPNPSYWQLALKLAAKEPVSLSAAEITAIENCVRKLPAFVSGQLIPYIDPSYKIEAVK